MLYTCIPLALTLSVPTLLPQEGVSLAAAPAADPLAALVPADATIIVRFASYERFAQAFTTLDDAMAPEGRNVDPADALGDMVPFMNESVRRDAPLLITFDALVDFGVTYVLPVDDVDAYVNHLVDDFGVEGVERGDGYVGFNPARSYTAGDNPLLAELGDRTITVAVDLAAILDQYGPLVEMGIDGMRGELAPLEDELGLDVNAMLDLYVDGFAAIEESATVLRAGLEVSGDTLEFHGEIGTAPDSALASFSSDTRVSYGDDLFLDPGAMMHGVLGFDLEESIARHGDLLDEIFAIYPPEMALSVQEAMQVWVDLAPSIGNVSTFSLRSFGPGDPLDAVYVYALDPDPDAGDQAVVSRYVEAITASSNEAAKFEALEPRTAGGLEFQRVRADFQGYFEGQDGWMGGAFHDIFDDLVISVADRGDALVLHMGPEDTDLADVVVSVSEPVVVGQAMSRAFREIRAATPAMVMSMDLSAFARAFDPSIEGSELPKSPIVTYAVVHEDRWAFGADLGISGLGALRRATGADQPRTVGGVGELRLKDDR